MSVPILPASAPFSAEQRAWLNGFFAGLLGLDGNASNGVVNNGVGADGVAALSEYNAAGESEHAHEREEFPWHDANLPLDERMQMAQGKPFARQLMAAMAQLDCGTVRLPVPDLRRSDCKWRRQAAFEVHARRQGNSKKAERACSQSLR
jgi:sulfite reductase (NADPH) flavoprotein alpha-component